MGYNMKERLLLEQLKLSNINNLNKDLSKMIIIILDTIKINLFLLENVESNYEEKELEIIINEWFNENKNMFDNFLLLSKKIEN